MKTAGAHPGHSGKTYALLLLAALLVWPTQRFIEARKTEDYSNPDILLFSSPGLLKKMALGYDELLADFYWIRTIQYYGRVEEADRRQKRYKNLYTLLDITTTLDPDNMNAYRMGCFFLADAEPIGAGKPEEALQLLDKGLRDHPQAWQLLYDKGFVYYWDLKDFNRAGETWLAAAKINNAPEWLTSMAALALARGGALQVALTLWQDRYLQSSRENERENAKNRLLSFRVAQDIWGWEALAAAYRAQNGSYPRNLAELTRGRTVQYSLTDPLGTPYHYDAQTGVVKPGEGSQITYLDVPDIYKNELVAAQALTDLLPAR